jgi:hypothetical protein
MEYHCLAVAGITGWDLSVGLIWILDGASGFQRWKKFRGMGFCKGNAEWEGCGNEGGGFGKCWGWKNGNIRELWVELESYVFYLREEMKRGNLGLDKIGGRIFR